MRITGISDVNISMADGLSKEANQSRDHTDEGQRTVEFLYEQDLKDGFGQEVNEVMGQTRVHANEHWEQQTAQSQAVVNANDQLMDAVQRARQLFH